MSPALTIALLWIAFAVTHMLLSSARLRPKLVSSWGTGPYLGVFSLVALAIFIPLVSTYFANKASGEIYYALAIGPFLRWFIYIGMGVAIVMLVSGATNPSPVMFGVSGDRAPLGVLRITRHPVFMAVGIFGALHLLPNGRATDITFFAGFPIFAILGCWHQDRRRLLTQGESFREFMEQTAFLPFTGSGTLRGLRELSPVWVAVGVALTFLLRHFHAQLFV